MAAGECYNWLRLRFGRVDFQTKNASGVLGTIPRCRAGVRHVAQGCSKGGLEFTGSGEGGLPTASIIANDRVVFNIKGNTYRLVVHIRYQQHKVFIRFIGTHADYDKIKAEEV